MENKGKLVELLRNMPIPEIAVFGQRCGKALVTAEFIADYLIANGVTVQEWISVKERLPENIGRYLTANIRANDERCVFDLWFDYGKWYIDEEDDEFIYKVTHWMPLPEPPKGE